jgi:hypothetical protein
MTDKLVPDWVRGIQLQEQQQAAMDKHKEEARLLEEKTIKADGPEFWRQFLEQVQITVQSLPEIGIIGQLVSLGGADQGHMIQLTQPRQTYTNIFYDGAGAPGIRCYPDDGAPFNLNFVAVQGKLTVKTNTTGGMSAGRAAQYVIEPMVNKIKAR